MRDLLILAVVCLSGGSGFAVEVATGRMLGSGYEERSFYVRQPGSRYTGSEWVWLG